MKLHKTKEKEVFYYYLKNGEKRFMYRHLYYDVTGKRREKSERGFTSLNAAIRSLLEVKAALLDGNMLHGEHDNLTIGQWFNLWYETYNNNWAVTTRVSVKRFVDNNIKLIAHFKLNDFTRSQYINNFIKPLKDKYANQSVKQFHTFFSMGINAAIQDEILDRNRFTNVKIGEGSNLTNFLKPNELNVLLDYAKNSDIVSYTTILTLAYSGMRKGELTALTWKDIDLKNNIIKINKTRDHYGLRKTKTRNSNRSILINEALTSQLKKYKTWCKKIKLSIGLTLSDKDYVFIDINGCGFHTNSCKNILESLYEQMEQDSVKINRITAHGLRHTMATILISNGVPVTTIAERLGNTADMVLNTYTHSFEELEKKAVNVLNKVINF